MSIYSRSILCAGMVVLAGCFAYSVKPHEPFHEERVLPFGQAAVVDAALAEAHALNLDVKVIDRQSGLIRFERSSIPTDEMERYLVYPLEPGPVSAVQKTWATAASLNYDPSGTITLAVLATARGDSTGLDVRSNATATLMLPPAAGGARTFPARSTGKLESEFIDGVQKRLSGA